MQVLAAWCREVGSGRAALGMPCLCGMSNHDCVLHLFDAQDPTTTFGGPGNRGPSGVAVLAAAAAPSGDTGCGSAGGKKRRVNASAFKVWGWDLFLWDEMPLFCSHCH